MPALVITHTSEGEWYYQEATFTSRHFSTLEDLFAELKGLGKVTETDDDKREF